MEQNASVRNVGPKEVTPPKHQDSKSMKPPVPIMFSPEILKSGKASLRKQTNTSDRSTPSLTPSVTANEDEVATLFRTLGRELKDCFPMGEKSRTHPSQLSRHKEVLGKGKFAIVQRCSAKETQRIFEKGTAVEVKFRGREPWLAAKIHRCNASGQSYNVEYEAGGAMEFGVPPLYAEVNRVARDMDLS